MTVRLYAVIIAIGGYLSVKGSKSNSASHLNFSQHKNVLAMIRKHQSHLNDINPLAFKTLMGKPLPLFSISINIYKHHSILFYTRLACCRKRMNHN